MRKFSPLLFACLFFSAHHPAFAQDAKSIEAAKKEGGKVVFYTTMETFTLDAVKAALKRKPASKSNIGAPGSPMFWLAR